MTTTFKTFALTTILAATSMPAFASSTVNLASMTCGQYNEMSADEQMEIATLALAEVNDGDNGESLIDNNRATDATGGETTGAEADNGLSSDADLRANSDINDTTNEATMQNKLERFQTICERNPTTTVSEAAIGDRGKG